MLCRLTAEEAQNGETPQGMRGLDALAAVAAVAEAADAQALAVCKPVAELYEDKMHLGYQAPPPPLGFR